MGTWGHGNLTYEDIPDDYQVIGCEGSLLCSPPLTQNAENERVAAETIPRQPDLSVDHEMMVD